MRDRDEVMTSQEIARYEMTVEEVARKISSESGTTWDEREFFKVRLILEVLIEIGDRLLDAGVVTGVALAHGSSPTRVDRRDGR